VPETIWELFLGHQGYPIAHYCTGVESAGNHWLLGVVVKLFGEPIVVPNAPDEAANGDEVEKRWGHGFALEGGDLVGDGRNIGIHFQLNED
jgi:hypothetical protein